MTTASKTPQTILAGVASSTYGSTKGTPAVDSGWVDLGAAVGGDLGMSIMNGSTGPGVAGQMVAQWSPDNTFAKVYDLQVFGGDTVGYVAASDVGHNTITVWIDPGIRYIRVRGYGHTVNPVTYAADFSGVTYA